ncbi:hypothetical protein BH11ACT8_BH11ACT8_21840 [soil metagenome]
MPQAMTKAALVGLACLATVSAGTISPAASMTSSAVSKQAAPAAKKAKTSVTRFGYNATVFGTKVSLGGVEIRTLKDALVNRPCTRRSGLESTSSSLLSTDLLPGALTDLVDFSLSTSSTQTYRRAGRGLYGIRAVNTLADLTIGGEVLGVKTPAFKIKGLQSVADSFYDGKADGGNGAFKTKQSFGYGGLQLVLSDEDQISQTVSTLFGILGVDPVATLNQVVEVPLTALLGVIGTLPLELPGLGSISLGSARGKTTDHGAVAEAYALKIKLDGNDAAGIPATLLQLGRAISTISEPVKAGVFRSKMSALEADIGGLLSVGGVGQRTVPCEGTDGKVVTSRVARAGVPQVLSLNGITYAYKGVQNGQRARGFVSTTIGEVKLLQAGVVLQGISSRVNLRSNKPNSRVRSTASTKVAKLLIGGEEVSLPALGKWLSFKDSTGQTGRLRLNVLDPTANGFFGKHLTGVQIALPGTNTTIDLGVANGEIFFR